MNRVKSLTIPKFIPQVALFICLLIIASIAGCTKESSTGPAGESNLMDPAIMPHVVSTLPADGSIGPFDLFEPYSYRYKPNFIIQLNKLIYLDGVTSRPSVITAQGFNKPVIVQLYWKYYYPVKNKSAKLISNGPYDNILAFNIYDSATYHRSFYEIGKTYSITIDTSFEDINHNHLQQPYHFSFLPEPYFRVTAIYPMDHSTNFAIQADPSISFNSPIDDNILSSLHITPNFSGTWYVSMNDSFTVSFRSIPFEYNTVYTITVDGNAHDKYGHLINSPYTSTFTTTAFKINYTYPNNGSFITYLSTSINISFSGDIDTNSVRTAFSIAPSIAGYFSIYPDRFDFNPTDGFAPNTNYTVTISTALQSIDGIHLATPYIFSFSTDRLRVTSTDPYDGAILVGRTCTSYVYFNSKIDSSSVRAAFHITPDVPVSFGMSSYKFSFTPTTQYAALTTYTVTIDSTMRSKSGSAMGVPYIFSFKTGL